MYTGGAASKRYASPVVPTLQFLSNYFLLPWLTGCMIDKRLERMGYLLHFDSKENLPLRLCIALSIIVVLPFNLKKLTRYSYI
jgi:hypothetical protein